MVYIGKLWIVVWLTTSGMMFYRVQVIVVMCSEKISLHGVNAIPVDRGYVLWGMGYGSHQSPYCLSQWLLCCKVTKKERWKPYLYRYPLVVSTYLLLITHYHFVVRFLNSNCASHISLSCRRPCSPNLCDIVCGLWYNMEYTIHPQYIYGAIAPFIHLHAIAAPRVRCFVDTLLTYVMFGKDFIQV